MPNYTARQMLSQLPLRRAEGGPVYRAYGGPMGEDTEGRYIDEAALERQIQEAVAARAAQQEAARVAQQEAARVAAAQQEAARIAAEQQAAAEAMAAQQAAEKAAADKAAADKAAAEQAAAQKSAADKAAADKSAADRAASLLAAEKRVMGEMDAAGSNWNAAQAYNEILKSGVTTDEALAAGVKQESIDRIFSTDQPITTADIATTSGRASAFDTSAAFAGQDLATISQNAQNYLATMMEDGVISPEERRETQAFAIEQGVTFQDMEAAGVDPNILFDTSAADARRAAAEKAAAEKAAADKAAADKAAADKAAADKAAADKAAAESAAAAKAAAEKAAADKANADAAAAAKAAAEKAAADKAAADKAAADKAAADKAIADKAAADKAAADKAAADKAAADRAAADKAAADKALSDEERAAAAAAAADAATKAAADKAAAESKAFDDRVAAEVARLLGEAEAARLKALAEKMGAAATGVDVNNVAETVDEVTTEDIVSVVSDNDLTNLVLDNTPSTTVIEGTTTTPVDTTAATAVDTGINDFLETYVAPTATVFPTYTADTVYQPLPDPTPIYAEGETALDTEFRESAPRTATYNPQGAFTGYDYTTAAKLMPATGSGMSWTPPSVTSRPRQLLSSAASMPGLSASQRFARARQGQQATLMGAFNDTGAKRNSANYYDWMNQIRSGMFNNSAGQFDNQLFLNAFNPWAASQTSGAGTTTTGQALAAADPYTVKAVDLENFTGFDNFNAYGGTEVDGEGRPFAGGGYVKKPRGFADGGPANSMTAEELTAQLMAMDSAAAAQAPRPTDQVQTESRSMLDNILSGAKQMPSTVYEYGKDVVQSQSPSAKLLTDIYKVGKTMQTGAADDPVGYALDMAPVTGEIRSGMDVEKFSDLANEARAAGDTEAAKMYEQLVTMSMAGAAPGLGILARGAKRTAKAGAEAATQSAKMLDEIAPVATKAPEAPTVYPAEKLRANPVVANDPVAVRFNEQIAADPQAAIEQYKLIPKTKGGKILNSDLWRELSPDYLADRSLAQSVHQPASEMNKLLYQQRLAEDMGKEGVWVFTGGGAASGKSAGLSDAAEDAADLVMDGTLANFDKSVGQIDLAADSGKSVEIVYIDRDPQKAITQMLDRAIDEGRPVPLKVFLDAHRDARSSIKKIAEKYADDPRVNIDIWNNQGGKGEQFLTTVDNLSEMDYDTALTETLKVVDEYYAANKIDQNLYDAIKGDLQPRTGSAQKAVPSSNGGRNTQSGSKNFINDFRRNSLSSGVSAEARNISGGVDGGNISGPSGPYTRETVQTDGVDGLLTFLPEENALRQYQENAYSLPTIRQVDAVKSAASYNADMTKSMAGNPMGPQVEIKTPEELAQARLFRTESGSGFAIKPDGDIVAVFASSNEPARGSYAMLQAAVQAGGTKLDAFDTYLPKIYEKAGFRPVARLPWNDEFAPPNWDKKVFEEYNAGEPDIVFFVHDSKYFGGAKDVPVVTDYDDAVRLQDEALGAVTPVTQNVKTDIQKATDVTEQQRQDWREANKGDFRQEQTPELAEAAEKLGRGEISISDYSKEVDRLRPITPLTEVPRISSFEDIASALDANKVAKGIIGLDTEIADGTMVGSRLDIPAYNSYNTWVVSVHEGAGTSGSSLGYGKIAVLDDVKFNSNAKSAFGVATGKKPKASFARMNGKWRNVDPEVAKEQAEKFINDPNWTQVGMNPYRHSFFYDKATGQPVDSAKEVIQIGPLVLAKDVKTRPLESPEHALDPKKRKKGEPDYFKSGGSVERVYNDNRTYK